MCLIMGYTHVYPRNGAAIFGKIRNHLQQTQAYTHIYMLIIYLYIYLNMQNIIPRLDI